MHSESLRLFQLESILASMRTQNFVQWNPTVMPAHLDELNEFLQGRSNERPDYPLGNQSNNMVPLLSLLKPPGEWEPLDLRLASYFLHRKGHYIENTAPMLFFPFFEQYARQLISEDSDGFHLQHLLAQLRALGLHEHDIMWGVWKTPLLSTESYFYEYRSEDEITESTRFTSSGQYVLANLDRFRLQFNNFYRNRRALKFLLTAEWLSHRQFLPFLPLNFSERFEEYVRDVVIPVVEKEDLDADFWNAKALIDFDAVRFERLVASLPAKHKALRTRCCLEQLLMARYAPIYDDLKVASARRLLQNGSKWLYAPDGTWHDPLPRAIETLLAAEGTSVLPEIEAVFAGLTEIPDKIAEMLIRFTGREVYSFFLTRFRLFFKAGFQDQTYDVYRALSGLQQAVRLLTRLDIHAFNVELWPLAKHPSKKLSELAAVSLAKLGDKAVPQASQLLSDGKAAVRETGALLLSLIGTEAALFPLRDALDTEANDDARDLMLVSLDGRLPVPQNPVDIAERVEKARQRGKLTKPLEPWLSETSLPPLFFTGDEKPLEPDTVRFLLYRMSRVADIGVDPEARPLLALLDPARCQPFGKTLLETYLLKGAPPKHRFCLTLSSRLGGEAVVPLLTRAVAEWVDANRGKMAEYAVKALALNGSNRALRAVELFSRKYRSKNRNIGAAAEAAFVLAADELGLTPHELADSIVPDFGFEGLFQSFEAEGDGYRAFIDGEFKLAFLNEDGKVLKSAPKPTPAGLKEEFKEISKEIRELVKAQSGRMEQYLITQRRWSVVEWEAFFLQKPLMFVYATRLLWGAFDPDGTLRFCFLCQEDQSLVDSERDERSLPDDAQIGMVHPLSLPADEVSLWREAMQESDLSVLFAQLDRPVFHLPSAQRALTFSEEFTGSKCPGFDFVRRMEKMGWQRGSVVDAGWISGYRKDFPVSQITAFVRQTGELSVGYYQGQAELGTLMFLRVGTVQFGNYVYDEPTHPDDPRLVPFGQVPPIVYSEVMADLQAFTTNPEPVSSPTTP